MKLTVKLSLDYKGCIMTYGEAHTIRKESLRLQKGVFVADPLRQHLEKMDKKQASVYYNKKCRDVFVSLGFEYDNSYFELEQKIDYLAIQARKATNKMLKKEIKKLRSA